MSDDAQNSESSIGSVIRKIRLRQGLTLVEVAEKIGTKHGPLSKIERGHSNPSIPMLESIAQALGVSPADFWLDTGEGDSEPVAESRGGIVRTMTLENVIMDPDYTVRGILAFEGAPAGTHAARIAKALKFGHLHRAGKDDYRTVEIAGVPKGCTAIDLRIPLDVRVAGETTMLIPAGYVLIVDPEREPKHEDLVVAARDPEDNPDPEEEEKRPPKAELRRYEEGPRGVPMLFQLDRDAAETVSQGWRIAGVVVEIRQPKVVDPSAE